MIHQVVHHPFGVAENNAKFEIMNIDEPREQLDFVTPIHFVKNLLDGGNSESLLFNSDVLRGARIFLDQLLNRPGIVAEKKTVCRSLGVAWRINSMSSRK